MHKLSMSADVSDRVLGTHKQFIAHTFSMSTGVSGMITRHS